ncbi:FRG domain-containing protein (plasmid) [Vibrio alfacsensis]|uniref:FRG domain-containing protein n=1 Tax=Vibrio alfacsensis TaxID=1074311 RepID=UPI002ADDF9DE|nr:FRG domain-containing protein [Vibrio alfacsensis]WQE79481.1 FRG domain-containing protein [Vibrio alfacsensis]
MNELMTTYRVESIEMLHKLFSYHSSRDGLGFWFRGQANSEWELQPAAGRKEFILPKNGNRDLGRCAEWSRSAIAMTDLPGSFVETLAIAQHHGLATRLLDWTLNPLVACFFAVSSEPDKDAAIYLLESVSISTYATSSLTREQLEEFKGVLCYQPKAINRRLISQKGLFTIHCPPSSPFPVYQSSFSNEDTMIKRCIIPAELKGDLRKMLDNYGVNEAALFPDLDGLARYVNRKTCEMK